MGGYRGVGSRIFTGQARDSFRQPIRLLDTSSTSKPTGTITIDGFAPVNGDRVIFTALTGSEAGDNNKVFRAIESGGTVSGWTLDVDARYPNGSALDGDVIYAQEGTSNGDKLYKFTGTAWAEVAGGGGGANQFLSNLLPTNINEHLIPQSGKTLGSSVNPWTSADINAITVAAGAATTPSINFVGSLTTGFYSGAANTINVSLNGVARYVFDPSGSAAFRGTVNNSQSLGTTSIYFSSSYINNMFAGSSSNKILVAASLADVPSTVSMAGISLYEHDNLLSLGLITANSSTVNTRSIRLETGNVTSGAFNSGNIVFRTGTVVSGTRGSLLFDEVSRPSAVNGYVWTLQDQTTGRGAWAVASGSGGPQWTKYTITNSSSLFSVTAQFNEIELFSLPAKTVIHSVIMSPTTRFAGTSLTQIQMSIGIGSDLSKYASNFDLTQAPDGIVGQATNILDFENINAATSIRVAAYCEGGNLSAMTQGSIDIWVLTSLLP